MSKRLGVAGVILLMIAIGAWVASPRHSNSSRTAINVPAAGIAAQELKVQPVGAPVTSGVGSIEWKRPAPKAAARNLRRARLALLRKLGASDKLVDRLTDGDVLAVVTELKEKAQRGDQSAANTLAYIAHIACVFASPNVQEAQGLPGQDAEWLNTAIQEKIAYNKQLSSVCQQAIDRKEVDGWVAKSADQGNGASLWLLSLFGSNNPAFKQQKLQEAVDAGYPEAQAMMAELQIHPPPNLSPSRVSEDAEFLLKEAAINLPYAESTLAVCEFAGCPGIAMDIPAAVMHAREAAQRGVFDAMIEIGPQLQASQIDPTEVAAWNLVGAMLAQQGCSYGGLSVQLLKTFSDTLTSNRVSAGTRALADEYWRDYGAQMMSNIGCTP